MKAKTYPGFKTFKINALLSKNRHFAWLPYHLDFNPTEFIYSSMKKHVAKRNTNFKLHNAIGLAEEKFNFTEKEEWSLQYKYTRKCKDEYLALKSVTDEISDSIISVTVAPGETKVTAMKVEMR
jgi:hypothetical protein